MVQILDVRETVVPIKSDLRNAYIDFSQMTVSVVAIVTDVIRDGRPVVGYGFNSNGRYAPSGLLRERFIPRLKNAKPDSLLDDSGANLDPERIWRTLMANEKPGGHGERSVAVGVLDMAAWDAVAKIEGVPLWRLLADRYRGGEADSRVFVYAAGGYYYPEKGLQGLQDEMRSYLARGYDTVKMKIGGATLDEDRRRIDAVLEIVGDPSRLAVDANGRFDLETAIAYAEALRPYRLRWYEEAGDPLDYALQAELANHYDLPMATGENLFSMQDARNLILHGGMRADRDILQFDCALSYGLVEYRRTLEMLARNGWSSRRCIPHGGHQMSLNIAAGLGLGGNESYPDVFFPFNGFADGVAVEDGYVGLPDVPGIGFETKAELSRVMRDLGDRADAMRARKPEPRGGLLPGFERNVAKTQGAEIAYAVGGNGPPLLLLHGNPFTHLSWHAIAPQLAERYTVVLPDLRGYGDSSKPGGGDDHEAYSFRAMAQDQIDLMRGLGFERFRAAGHDRGARVLHRLCLDHPDAVERAAFVDMLPQHHLLNNVSRAWGNFSWHWFFMNQRFDTPERMMGADPEWFLRRKLSKTDQGVSFFAPAALDEYIRCIRNPATIHGMCEDYRATFGIDLEMDGADFIAGRKVTCPVLLIWGARGGVGRNHNPYDVWSAYATDIKHALSVPSGHYVQEECPTETLEAFRGFFSGAFDEREAAAE